MALIKGISPDDAMRLPPLPELIAREAQRYGINRQTEAPLSYVDVAKKIHDGPALLMLTLLKDPMCSIEGTANIIEVIAGIAGNKDVNVAELDFHPPLSGHSILHCAAKVFWMMTFIAMNTCPAVFALRQRLRSTSPL